jgi:hypothetical protein
MGNKSTVAVAVKTAVGTIDSIASKFMAMGAYERSYREERYAANQQVSLDLNSYFVVEHAIMDWEKHHVRSPSTAFQKIVKDVYDGLKKRFDDAGYKGFAAKFGEAKKYAPAMRLEGDARKAALVEIQKARGVPAARSVHEVFTYRMKDGKKEWGDLAALYKTTARFYFATAETAIKSKITEDDRKKLFKTMGILASALREWKIDPDLITAEK